MRSVGPFAGAKQPLAVPAWLAEPPTLQLLYERATRSVPQHARITNIDHRDLFADYVRLE
jgi:hypothetical protein